MVMRAVICKDDPTSHGGVVVEGNALATVKGRQIAQKGHMTRCPRCKGDFPIVEGLPFRSIAGVGMAVEGMKTACGATLIATTTQGFMMVEDQSEAGESATAAAAATAETAATAAAAVAASTAQAVVQHAASFRAVDEHTGEALPDMPYRIELPDGSSLRGRTDADGYTERVNGHDPAMVRLHWESGTADDSA